MVKVYNCGFSEARADELQETEVLATAVFSLLARYFAAENAGATAGDLQHLLRGGTGALLINHGHVYALAVPVEACVVACELH